MSEGTYSNHVPGWNYNGEYFRTPIQLRDAINQTIVDALLPPEEES